MGVQLAAAVGLILKRTAPAALSNNTNGLAGCFAASMYSSPLPFSCISPLPAVTYNEGFLGQENEDYQAWILDKKHWWVEWERQGGGRGRGDDIKGRGRGHGKGRGRMRGEEKAHMQHMVQCHF